MASESVHELEQDIAQTRSRLNGTIDRIQEKLTVSGIVDEMMGQAGVPRLESGHDFVLGLLRRHPVPVMIVAAGIGFAVYRMNKRAAARNAVLVPLGESERLQRLPRGTGASPAADVPIYAPDLSLSSPATDAGGPIASEPAPVRPLQTPGR